MSTLLTAEEFGRMPERDDGAHDELVRGEVVIIGPLPGAMYGLICSNVGGLLHEHVERAGVGRVTARAGVILQRNPDTVRAPSVAYYSFTRLPHLPQDYFEIAPDIAVEVLSPDAKRSAVRAKIAEYIAAGVRLVWLVDPETRTVLEYRGSLHGTEYDEAETITGADVLPEFTCRVADFFA
jgi:Uma2 family endonuclease